MFNSTQIFPLEAPYGNENLGPLPPSQLPNHENEETILQAQAPVAVATHTRTIGIIEPPSGIRTIIELMAEYVAKNGVDFEQRVKANNARNDKFNFLNRSDPYHAYYQQKRTEYRARYLDGAHSDDDDSEGDDAQPDPQAQFRVATEALEPPESEKYTVRIPEWITGEELDIIKLTAQFAARNGNSFFRGLQCREGSNPKFNFMKPTNGMYAFFTSMADAYSAVLMPPKDSKGTDIKEKLRKSAACLTTVLELCLHRLEWDRSQELQREKEENEKELESVQMAMIDWHDFAVVESVDFIDEEDDNLYLPMTLEEVIRRSEALAMEEDEFVEPGNMIWMEMDEEEAELVAEGMTVADLEENGGSTQTENVNNEEVPMRIVENWRRPEDRFPTERNPIDVVVSPITGELIPINEMSEHMRISLIDPKFKEQKDRMFAKIRETTLAPDDEIAKNIVGLARLRPDIFGTTEEEVSNAVKAEIGKKNDEQPKQVIWDGQSGTIDRAANQALSQNSDEEEQSDCAYGDANSFPGAAALPPHRPVVPTIWPLPPSPYLALNLPHPSPSVQYPGAPRPLGVPLMRPMHQQYQHLMPGPRGHPSMMMNQPPQMQPGMPVAPPPGSQLAHLQVPRPYNQLSPSQQAPPPLHEEPEPKRQRFDESALLPEEQFLAQHPGSATIRVSVPNMDDGQVIEITVESLSVNVGSLKEKIAGETQIPANKQKLSGNTGFLKDNMSLAHYNVGAGENLTLSLRERGGRKR